MKQVLGPFDPPPLHIPKKLLQASGNWNPTPGYLYNLHIPLGKIMGSEAPGLQAASAALRQDNMVESAAISLWP
ncbi:hypothetical protein IFR05_007888 [Cadophora sp. M221]|nr:hypothetical protein IFR05_007888 [Cadophora sp. M221]